ncbi:TadE/TadG family type IV pilus assembly protein [Pseudalkalibacillus berkeleyi]|uniref:Pilus assembly protein TadG-related protein n=1 Tax=Pseudalkalibacillus berkeleyi TaxID=1069813 RepID=A0ABS9H2U3_9BACL|nr:TadE/TadG family type IV pilus assembly protein [Pseudalkalibacillus berkeleyi]MCF6139279.1 pilus assembly protein TadG-related protein [Pseudalkalibacillus berkeleyi]
MLKRRNPMNEESGSTIVLVGLAMVALLAIMGLVIDGGSLYMTKSHLQKVANASVLSGAQELTVSESEVRQIVEDILKDHAEIESLETMNIKLNDEVRVQLSKDVPLHFSNLFGLESTPVKVKAAASIMSMSEAVGAAPLGIDDSIPLEFYRPYQLKVGPHDNESGVFGILALGGTGAKTYEENLRNGYQSPIKIGDIIDTQTGNIAGKTRSVINELVNACTVTEEEMKAGANPRDCERILLVPVYEPYDADQNQMKSIKVTGFAYFYIMEPMDQKSTEIFGMFIKRAGTGFVDETMEDNGAYGIRLTE